MTHAQKVEIYKSILAAAGVPAGTAVPPFWRLLWASGSSLPPPPFMGFFPLALLTGSLFGLLFSAVTWAWSSWGMHMQSLEQAAWVALLAGGCFGVIMALYYRRLGRKHRLGSWAAFPPPKLRT